MKKYILLTVLINIIGCGGTKKTDINDEYKKYKVTQGIKVDSVMPFQHFKDFLVFKKEQNKQLLLHNSYLKINKVYAYQGNTKEITFCLFSEDGYLYMAEAYKIRGTFLTEPKDGKRELRKPFDLIFLGFFELEDSFIKISRNEKTRSGEKNQSDIGYIKHDTITLIAFYNTKKYSYEKKILTRNHKTNFKLIYQPDLIVTKFKNELGSDLFRIEGSLNTEKKSDEEKM